MGAFESIRDCLPRKSNKEVGLLIEKNCSKTLELVEVLLSQMMDHLLLGQHCDGV